MAILVSNTSQHHIISKEILQELVQRDIDIDELEGLEDDTILDILSILKEQLLIHDKLDMLYYSITSLLRAMGRLSNVSQRTLAMLVARLTVNHSYEFANIRATQYFNLWLQRFVTKYSQRTILDRILFRKHDAYLLMIVNGIMIKEKLN